MIDIDHFKRFNDLHGHVAGDECLKAVAAAMSATITRAADLVARFGGDEFGAILPETDEDRSTHLAEDLRRRIEKLTLKDLPTPARVTVSIGVSTEVPGEDRSAADLIRSADASLYIAKNEGRNLVHSNPRIKAPKGFFDQEG